jgi:hypothetical protein
MITKMKPLSILLLNILFIHFVNAQDINASIEKSKQYLHNRNQELFKDAYVIIDYLNRKYDLQFQYDSVEVFNKYNHPDAGHIAYYYRLINPAKTISASKISAIDNERDKYLIEALYCDLFPTQNNTLETIRLEIEEGRYALTHAFLAIQWLKEKKCIDIEKIKELELLAIEKIYFLAKQENYETDLGIEAVALLLYSGNKKYVSKDIINKIISVQKADGGWAYNPDKEKSNDHTTILALWALIAYHRHESNPEIKWSVRN